MCVVEKIISFIPNPLDMEGAIHVFDHASPLLAQVINTRVLISKTIQAHEKRLLREETVERFSRAFLGNCRLRWRDPFMKREFIKETFERVGFSGGMTQMTRKSVKRLIKYLKSGVDIGENGHLFPRLVTNALGMAGILLM